MFPGFGYLCLWLVTLVIGWVIRQYLFRPRNRPAPIAALTTERAVKLLSVSAFGWGADVMPYLRFPDEAVALSLVCKSFNAAVRRQAWPLPVLGGPLATPVRLDRVIDSRASELGQSRYPRGVALTPCQTRVIVTDPSNQRLLVLDAAGGRPVCHVTPPAGVLPCPVGVVVVPDTGQVLVVDRQRCQVLLFAGVGSSELVRTFGDGGPGDEDRQLARPCGVALVTAADIDLVADPVAIAAVAAGTDPAHIAIADTCNHRVSLYRLRDASLVRHLGQSMMGSAPGVFMFPCTIAAVPSICTPDGHSGWLAVADEFNCRVQVLTQLGQVVRVLVGDAVNGLGPLSQALWGITVCLGSNGRAEVLVSDANHHRVVAFALDGNAARVVCPSGRTTLSSPSGLAVAAGGQLWLADQDTDSLKGRICLLR
jgi:hypothetical protein